MPDVYEAQVREAEREFIESWARGPRRLRWDTLPPQSGDVAPDARLLDHTGAQVALSSFWQDRPALVLFWRHFGCGCGVERAGRLRDEIDDLVAAGANLVIVGQGEPERAARYRHEHGLPCPILCDPNRELYRAYGLREGDVPHILFDAPEEFWTHNRAIGEEFQHQRRESGRPLVDSPWQLPGEFVVDTSGTIRLDHHYQHCEDFPPPLVLIAGIKQAWQRLLDVVGRS
jgi:peroxiredoxin